MHGYWRTGEANIEIRVGGGMGTVGSNFYEVENLKVIGRVLQVFK